VTVHHDDPRVQRVIDLFERLQPADLDRLELVYTDDVAFKDPFNDVRSRAEVRRIFAHMFRTLDEPRFVMLQAVAQGDDAFLTWEMHFRMQRFDRGPQVIRGATQLRFAPDGRVALHRDWWDAAEELYEKLPVLGALMRWLRRQAKTG
jgi:ketosteroid isomerase-like protein